MFIIIIIRCVTNKAGQRYLTIEVNCREASLTLWGSHYKMGIFAKIVQFKSYLKAHIIRRSSYEDIKILFVWTLHTVMRVIQLIWKLKNLHLFRTLQSPGSWPIESRVIAGFFQSFGSFGSLVFRVFPVLISFAYTTRNPMSMEFPSKDQW